MNAFVQSIPPASRSASDAKWGTSLAFAGVIHLALGVFAWSLPQARAKAAEVPPMEVSTLPPEPPPPTVHEPEEPPKPAPELVQPVVQPTAAPAPAAHAPPPPAAAGQVLAAPDNGPVDLTGGMVVGNADTYAGGATASNGTSSQPVPVAGSGVAGSVAPKAAPPSAPIKDLSRSPHLAAGGSWNDCPFPPEADSANIDDAYVGLRIEVDATGKASTVEVTEDPGHGFGRVATGCARAKTFSPALDATGASTTAHMRIRIHFRR